MGTTGGVTSTLDPVPAGVGIQCSNLYQPIQDAFLAADQWGPLDGEWLVRVDLERREIIHRPGPE